MTQNQMFVGGQTLAEARETVEAKLGEGTTCPCCNQYAKRYRRKLNTGMAISIIWLVRTWKANGEAFVNVPKIAPRRVIASRPFDKLKLWGLATDLPRTTEEKKRSGFWRPQILGVEFSEARIAIPSYLEVFNSKIGAKSAKLITIEEVPKFNYQEMMATITEQEGIG